MVDVYLYQGHASPNDVTLRPVTPDVSAALSVYLYAGHASPNDVILRYSGEVSGGGGSTYNENISETVTLAESVGTTAAFTAAISEALALSEGVSTAAVFAAGLAEAVTLVEALSDGMVYTEGLAEAIALAEALLEQLLREYPTPANRTLFTVVEDRDLVLLYTLLEALRTMATGQAIRTLTAQVEDRQAEPQTEGRTLYVGAESRTELAEGE